MKRESVEVVISHGSDVERMPLQCYVFDANLALGRPFRSRGWAMIHRASGHTIIGGMHTLKEAKSVATGVRPLGDWSLPAKELTEQRGLYVAVLEVAHRVKVEYIRERFTQREVTR